MGRAVIKHLSLAGNQIQPVAAIRDLNRSKKTFSAYPNLAFRGFDFAEPGTFQPALEQMDFLFLLRPPQLADVDRYFLPLLQSAQTLRVRKIIFLSVQGADKSRLIPHYKIEQYIRNMGFDYLFVRPGYFMQNLTTTLLEEIKTEKRITLPAGKAKFNWIDVDNIGEVIAKLTFQFSKYQHQAIDITGHENLSFGEAAQILSEVTGKSIRFQSINPISFYFKKVKEGMSGNFALVMTMLHFLPRLQKQPKISTHYQSITGKPTTSLKEFIENNKHRFIKMMA